MTSKILITVTLSIFIAACSSLVPKAPPPSAGHLKVDSTPQGQIPEVVQQAPFVPPPEPQPQTETYTVVVNEVPVKELLFALARDAKVNVDINPAISGIVTINAVDQSLPQILDRISRQVAMRYEFQGDVLTVMPDKPYLRTYQVDYVNLSRDTENKVALATQIDTTGSTQGKEGGSSGGGNNNSTTKVDSKSKNHFWETLKQNLLAILEKGGSARGEGQTNNAVIVNSETGLIAVRATREQHEDIQEYIDNVQQNAQRQVLIEATIVEVTLNKQYQAGIDWSIVQNAAKAGLGISRVIAGAPAAAVSSLILNYHNSDKDNYNIKGSLKLLEEFGNTKVLSSPKMMLLNNQTAVLKVVQNFVYFEIDSTVVPGNVNTNSTTSFDTTAKTVPIGLVMTVTPQINKNDVVNLMVRPTISSLVDTVNDPNPSLKFAPDGTALANPIQNEVPVIRVREMESMLRIGSGEVAVLGGLMEDNVVNADDSIPFLSRLPGLGDATTTRTKTVGKKELVVFLKPRVMREPSLRSDLADFRPYLQNNVTGEVSSATPSNTP